MYIYGMFNTKVFSERVLLSRRDLDMGQEELSIGANISQAYISKIERGRTDNIGVETVFALAAALGVSPAYLMCLTDNPLAGVDEEEESTESPTIREASAPYITDPATKELLDLIQPLDAEQRRRFVDGAKLLLGVPRIIE